MDGSGKRIGNGRFQPGDSNEEASVVVVEEAPFDESSLPSEFFDCLSSDDQDPLAMSKKNPRRASDVGSVPLKPYVGAVCFQIASFFGCGSTHSFFILDSSLFLSRWK